MMGIIPRPLFDIVMVRLKFFKYILSTTVFMVFTCFTLWSQPGETNKVVKVMTFNILHGATTRGDFNLDLIAAVINIADPDLVALQEVDFKTSRARNYDLATELGLRTKMAPLFGKAMDYDGGAYGEGILSKYTFISTRNVPLPFSKGNEPRAALEAVIELPSGDTIAFIGTHLDHLKDPADRIAQATRIKQVFSGNKYPTLLSGDLNAVPGSEPMNILMEHWTPSYGDSAEPTIPSDNPSHKIDYILYHPSSGWKVIDRKIICDKIASDHCAYLVTLQLLD
jgi:endonuclease/exonuclease/phosphatase family metal-dependent hydrolase